MEDLAISDYADVKFRSEYVVEMVHAAVDEAREVTRHAVETTAKAVEAVERWLEETMSTFIAWAARHGIDVNDTREVQMTLRFSDAPSVTKAGESLREGFRVWKTPVYRKIGSDRPLYDSRTRVLSGVAVREHRIARSCLEVSLFWTPKTLLFLPPPCPASSGRCPDRRDQLDE